jgi:ABC-type uncharacterized transport system substrate-binding protein
MSPGHRSRDCGTGCGTWGTSRERGHRFEYRFAHGRAERFPALASELVNLPVDLIVAWGTPASLAAHKATSTIPIVMSAGDPVGAAPAPASRAQARVQALVCSDPLEA